ncbi:MAG TPA: DUF2905 domain-containing protein [Actinomycetota bacterium]|nr:DUF2905 domain-containing protein [Actinomycetota bacterium]
MDLSGVGKLLLILGALLAIFGLVFVLVGRGVIPRLPGDFSFGGRNWRVYLPIGTSILISIVLTVLLNIFFRG